MYGLRTKARTWPWSGHLLHTSNNMDGFKMSSPQWTLKFCNWGERELVEFTSEIWSLSFLSGGELIISNLVTIMNVHFTLPPLKVIDLLIDTCCTWWLGSSEYKMSCHFGKIARYNYLGSKSSIEKTCCAYKTLEQRRQPESERLQDSFMLHEMVDTDRNYVDLDCNFQGLEQLSCVERWPQEILTKYAHWK